MPVRWAIVYLAAAFWPVPVASAAQQPALWRVAGQAGFPGFSGDGGRAVDARLDTPTGIAFDTAGNLYVADTANSRVRRITPRGRISTIGRVRYPQAIAVDPQGNVFVADGDRSRILKRSPDGALTRFAGTGKSGFSGDGGPATAAALDSPSGLAVGGEGSVYIADTGNDRVRKVAPDGTITTVATGLGRPLGLSVDAAGALVVAAAGDNVVRKVAPDGAVTTVAGTGAYGLGGDGGPATEARLAEPLGVAVDDAGNVFIADTGNSRVRKVDLNGTMTTVAGGGDEGFLGDYTPATRNRVTALTAVAVRGNRLLFTERALVLEVGPAATSGPLVWTALSGTVTCGLTGVVPYKAVLCNSKRVPPPTDSDSSDGDPGFVSLAPRGQPRLARVSQYSWVGLGAIGSVAVEPGFTWAIRNTGISCTVSDEAVRCANRRAKSFTITRTAYRSTAPMTSGHVWMQASGCATDGGPDPPLWARHPTQFSISCDGHIFVTRARWQHWGRSTARATATLVVEKCDPSCATGPQRRIAVTVVATHVTDCVGRLVYRSVVLHWTQSGRRRTSEGPPQGCFHR